MIDFGHDTAGECFIVVRGSQRFPPMSSNLQSTQQHSFDAGQPALRTGRRLGALLRLLPHKSSMCLRRIFHRNDVAASCIRSIVARRCSRVGFINYRHRLVRRALVASSRASTTENSNWPKRRLLIVSRSSRQHTAGGLGRQISVRR